MGRTQLNWTTISFALSLREPGGALYLLLLVTALAILVALLMRQGGRSRLAHRRRRGRGSVHTARGALRRNRGRHRRCRVQYGAGCAATAHEAGARKWRAPRGRLRLALAPPPWRSPLCARPIWLVIAPIWASDLGSFGTGLSWWFPERAMAFIARENIPGKIFNTYNEGGYFTWRLGGRYRDYIDGRLHSIRCGSLRAQRRVTHGAARCAGMAEEAQRYNINAILVPLGRYEGLHLFPELRQFCTSRLWAPVYLDEVAAIFLRRQPENQTWLRASQLTEIPRRFPPSRSKTRPVSPLITGRMPPPSCRRSDAGEAFAATSQALTIFPDNAYLHFTRGDLWWASGRGAEAEAEYRQSLALEPNGETDVVAACSIVPSRSKDVGTKSWHGAGRASFFRSQHRNCLRSATPNSTLQHPKEALSDFDRAARRSAA